MSLQRRLLLYLLICAPLVWGVALLVSAQRARHEVNELFDTEIIRLALQVQSTLVVAAAPGQMLPRPPSAGEADLRDLAIAVWNRQGQLLLVDREGVQLPRRADATGFVDMQLGGEPWRVYYLQSPNGEWLVAAGQRGDERDELVRDLVARPAAALAAGAAGAAAGHGLGGAARAAAGARADRRAAGPRRRRPAAGAGGRRRRRSCSRCCRP